MQKSFDKKPPTIPQNLFMSFDPEQEQNMLENQSYFT